MQALTICKKPTGRGWLDRGMGLVLAMLGIALALSGCAAPREAAPRVVDAPTLRYTIGPLDTLNIVVWRNPELSTTVTVRPDGLISMPLIEDIPAAGRNPADLSREIEKSLAKYVRDPVVSIVPSGMQGAFSEQVRIVGEVVKPLTLPYRPNMTILDIMIQAGGMTPIADGNGAVLIRGAEGGKQYSLRLKDLLKRGDIAANVAVMPGDVILIPESLF
jgi:polysaccharide export outer membrane protein